MPEENEVELDKVREVIDEELEREGGSLLRLIALTTALLAAVAAIASLLAGSSVNEALVLKSEATQLQAQASDQWAYYQAKGVKAAVASTAATYLAASKRAASDSFAALAARYGKEQDTIAVLARSLERERDARSREASGLLARHEVYAYAVALLQVAIALGAVAALTRRRAIWILSAIGGVAGTLSLLWALLRTS